MYRLRFRRELGGESALGAVSPPSSVVHLVTSFVFYFVVMFVVRHHSKLDSESTFVVVTSS